MPEVGDEGFREVLVLNYCVIYRLDDENILIAAVAHGRQSLGIDDLASP